MIASLTFNSVTLPVTVASILYFGNQEDVYMNNWSSTRANVVWCWLEHLP